MRHWLWMNHEERTTWEREYSEEHSDVSIPRTYRYKNNEDSAQEDSGE